MIIPNLPFNDIMPRLYHIPITNFCLSEMPDSMFPLFIWQCFGFLFLNENICNGGTLKRCSSSTHNRKSLGGL